MKKMIIAALAVGVSLYLLFSAFIPEFEINKYADMQAVEDQKALKLGRLPGVMPPSAYDIAETHDPEMKNIYGMFSYKEPDEAAMMAKLSPLNDGNGTMGWEGFLLRVDTEKNHVKFRNKPAQH
jgi:hypothetical protein